MSILLAVALGLWAVGFLFAGRGRQLKDPERERPQANVSVIIPARNEEQNLPVLLSSLASQSTRASEVIVVDDHSTDRTATIANQFGARVIAPKDLPEGWRGKTWACQQGAEAATGDLLLFVDADTWFEPGGLEQILNRYRGGAFSVGPYHAVQKPYENLSLFFNFNMTYGTVPHGLFGQMLLIEREVYERANGHAVVRGKILENFWMARHLRSLGVPVRSELGRGVFSFRMYPNGVRELIAGWAKGFASGAGETPGTILLLIVLWITGLMLAPLAWLLTGGWLPLGGVYFLCAAQVWWFSRTIGAFSLVSALLYPLPLIFFFLVFAWSVLRSGKTVHWKGREIRAD